jgi:hypothetical protein
MMEWQYEITDIQSLQALANDGLSGARMALGFSPASPTTQVTPSPDRSAALDLIKQQGWKSVPGGMECDPKNRHSTSIHKLITALGDAGLHADEYWRLNNQNGQPESVMVMDKGILRLEQSAQKNTNLPAVWNADDPAIQETIAALSATSLDADGNTRSNYKFKPQQGGGLALDYLFTDKNTALIFFDHHFANLPIKATFTPANESNPGGKTKLGFDAHATATLARYGLPDAKLRMQDVLQEPPTIIDRREQRGTGIV